MRSLFLLLLTSFLITSGMNAQVWTWDGGGDGTTWEDPMNWDHDAIPPVDSFVTFTGEFTITSASAQVTSKLATANDAKITLSLDLTIGDGAVAEHNIVINSFSTLTLGSGYTFNLPVEASKNGISIFAGGEDAAFIIEEGATLNLTGGNNAINNASPSSKMENHGTINIVDSKNGINNKENALFINNGIINLSNPGETMVRAIICLGDFKNDTLGDISISTPNLDGIELKLDTFINYGTIDIEVFPTAGSGDVGIAVGTASESATFINAGPHAIINIDGGPSVDARGVYVYEEGVLTNSGKITFTGGNEGSRLYSRGMTINDLMGTIDVTDGRINVNTGTFINNGLVLSMRPGSGIFNSGEAINNGFFQYDSLRTWAIGAGIATDNGINLRSEGQTKIDFNCGTTADVAEAAYNYFEGATMIGSADATGLVTLMPSMISGDPVSVSPEGLPEVVLTFTKFGTGDGIEQVTASICDGETYDFNGEMLSEAGTYQDTVVSETGCESIVELTLSVLDNEEVTNDVTICEGDSYDFNGANLTASGTYSDTSMTEGGCMKIEIVNLTVEGAGEENITASICSGQVYEFNGSELTETGEYRDTITTEGGCELITILNLTVADEITDAFDASICSGSEYDFNGVALSESGTYVDTIVGEGGCNVIQELTLTVIEIEAISVSDTICTGDSLLFNEVYLFEPGEYEVVFVSAAGCDSIVNLTLVEDTECSTSTIDYKLQSEFVLVPNPVNSVIRVKGYENYNLERVDIIDTGGRIVKNISRANSSWEELKSIQVSDLNKGFYFLRAVSDNGIAVLRFVKL